MIPQSLASLPAALTLALAVTVGCQAKPKPMPMTPPPPTDAAYVQIKDDFAASSPDAKVGYVDEALGDAPWVSVSKIDASQFPVGSVVNLLDGDKHVLAQGNVERVVDGKAYVKYVKQGARAPMAGDVAVRF